MAGLSPRNIFFKTHSQAKTHREACGGDYLKAKSLNFPQNSEELADVLKFFTLKPGEQTGTVHQKFIMFNTFWFKKIFQSCNVILI
jgi:hypothetical protein